MGIRRKMPTIILKNPELAAWAVPGLIVASWLVYPCLNQSYRIEMGWEDDPMAGVFAVTAAKKARMEAHANRGKVKPDILKQYEAEARKQGVSVDEEEEDGDKEEAEEEEAEEEAEEETKDAGDDDEEEG